MGQLIPFPRSPRLLRIIIVDAEPANPVDALRIAALPSIRAACVIAQGGTR